MKWRNKQNRQYICQEWLYTDYYLTIRRARNSKWQREWENGISKLHYIKQRVKERESAYNSCRQHEVKLSRIRFGHTKLTHGYLMSRNEQQPTSWNAACGDPKLAIKNCLQDCPQWRDCRKKCNIHGDTRLWRKCWGFLKKHRCLRKY